MNSVLRGLGRIFLGLFVLFLVAWAIVAVLRWRAIGDAERAAVAVMDVPAPVLEGSNGFAALMLADFDVPADQQAAVLAADVARFDAWLADSAGKGSLWDATSGDLATTDVVAYVPFADTDWPRRPPAPAYDAPLCAMNKPGCLAQIQAAPEPVRALLAEQAGRVASLEQALAADHLYNAYTESLSTPLPAFTSLRLPLTAAALDAVDGRVPEAYSRTCRLLAGARRTDREGRNLLEKLMAQSLGEGAAWLLLDLRRAHPLAALPAECTEAVAAIDPGEPDICPALRGEYRLQRSLDRQLNARLQGWRPDLLATRALVYDSQLHAAWSATVFAPYCSDATRALAGTGELPPEPPLPVAADSAACYGAYINCMLINISTPNFSGYAGRTLDHAAMLRLLFAAQAVADGGVDAPTAALAAGNAGYPVTFDAEKQTATITLRVPRGDDGKTFAVDFSGLAPVAPAETSAGLDADSE